MSQGILYLFTSRFLWSVASAWFVTQALKVLVTSLRENRLKLHRLIEPGGMPSSHAAMVIALLTGVGLKEGITSTIFIVTLIFSLAIIYEAVGVRKEVEEQAEIINLMMKELAREDNKIESLHKQARKNLKETLGHSPLEVAVGSVIGFFITLLWLI